MKKRKQIRSVKKIRTRKAAKKSAAKKHRKVHAKPSMHGGWPGEETIAATPVNEKPNLNEVTGAGHHPGGVEPWDQRVQEPEFPEDEEGGFDY